MSNKPLALCFGEILWDSTPKGLFLGGAPANVAYHLRQLGVTSLPVSAVGADYLGHEILRRVSAWGVTAQHIRTIPDKQTGVVQVDLTHSDNPTYEILDDVAWDFIEVCDTVLALAAGAEALVFGSLALRHQNNALALNKLLTVAGGLKVFDVNLRSPFYDKAQIMTLARRADLVKLNEVELEILHPYAIGDLEAATAAFSLLVGTKQVCVTCGSAGAGFWDKSSWYWEPAQPVTAKGDAVGAGDAFLAALITGLIAQAPVHQCLKSACRLAEKVAAADGAQPTRLNS